MRFLPIFGLLALLAVAYAIDCGKQSSEEEDEKEFEEIAKKNKGLWDKINKDQSKKQGFAFHPKTDDDRKQRFKEKAKEAKEHNRKGDSKFCRKANEMDALDDDEIADEFLGVDLSEMGDDSSWPKPQQHGFAGDAELKNLPASVDHSEATGPVESQGGCGSCWAFAASHTLTGVVAKVGSKSVNDYSEQQITDCTYPDRDGGCKGGWMDRAWNYLKTKNAMPESQYPYTGRSTKTSCQDGRAKGTPFVTGAVKIRGEAEMRKIVAKHPISLAMLVGKGGFGSYRSGVYDYDGDDCKSLNHAMTIVGYGNENGDDYWLVKNSWGKNWGDKGYIKIKRGKNLCNIETYAMYPTVKEGGGGDHGNHEGGGGGDHLEWKTYKNVKYIFTGQKLDFELAEQFCLQNGAHLPAVNSQERHGLFFDLVRNHLELKARSDRVWIGANDRESEGQWRWTDSSAQFSFNRWNKDQPKSDGDCGLMSGGKWNAVNCDTTRIFLCLKFGEGGGDDETTSTASSSTTTSSTTTTTTTTTTTAKPAPDCKDDNTGCPHWKVHCGKHSYVIKHCKKTCGTCGSGPTTTITTPKPTTKPCKDENTGCPHWKSYCGKHSGVDKLCKKSCGTC